MPLVIHSLDTHTHRHRHTQTQTHTHTHTHTHTDIRGQKKPGTHQPVASAHLSVLLQN